MSAPAKSVEGHLNLAADTVIRPSAMHHLRRLIGVTLVTAICIPYIHYHVPTVAIASLCLALLAMMQPLHDRKGRSPLIWIVLFFATLLPYALTGGIAYGPFTTPQILAPLFLFIAPASMFPTRRAANQEGNPLLTTLARTTMASFIIGDITTLIGLHRYPLAARLLAADRPEAEIFKSMGIGGYGYLYAATLFCIPVSGLLLRRENSASRADKTLAATCLILTGATIVAAAYTIAIILAAISLVLTAIIARQSRLGLPLLGGALATLLIFKESAASGLLTLSQGLALPEVVQQKLADLALSLQGGAQGGSQTGTRFSLYEQSLQAWLHAPFAGLNGALNPVSGQPGGHSAWFDMLAYFGIVSTVPFLLAIFSWITSLRASLDTLNWKLASLTALMMLLLGLINPVTYIYEIGFIVFLMGPAVLTLQSEHLDSKVIIR